MSAMSATAPAWSSAADNETLINHLQSLSVDEYSARQVQQHPVAGACVPPTPPYGNVHTPQRPAAYATYDGTTQYLYYTTEFTPPSAGGHHHHQAYAGFELATPMTPLQSMQSMASAAGITFDPYPTPPENYPLQQDSRQGAPHHHTHQLGQLAADGAAAAAAACSSTNANPAGFQQQAAVAGRQGIYRPPHLQQQGQGYFAYSDRAPYWTQMHGAHGGQHASTGRDSGHQHHHPQRRINAHSHSGGRRGSTQGAHGQYPSLSEYNHRYGLQSLASYPHTPSPGHFSLVGAAPFTPASLSAASSSYNGGYGRRRSDEGPARSLRLEEFRQRRNSRMDFADVYGHICEFAGDQHGSRLIQNKLETATNEERALVFDEIITSAFQLMTDVFGNYVIQKFFEHGDENQRAALAKTMEGHVLHLSMNMYGCRVVQKALEYVLVDQRDQLVAELKGHIIDCVKSSNANHVIQRLITLDPPSTVTDAFQGHVFELSTHPFGCRVLQKSFEVLHPDRIRSLLDEMHRCSHKLMTDQFGNYVVQSIITNGDAHEYDRNKVVAIIKGRLWELCRHKFASNVVEKALKYASAADRRDLISEILGENIDGAQSRVAALLRDQYGNFPVQTALSEADLDQRELLLATILPLMPTLRHTPCGRRLEAKLNQYGQQQGVLPSLSDSVSASSTASSLKSRDLDLLTGSDSASTGDTTGGDTTGGDTGDTNSVGTTPSPPARRKPRGRAASSPGDPHDDADADAAVLHLLV